MNCIILGSKSDIAKQLQPMLESDGWTVEGWARGEWPAVGYNRWRLMLIALGRVAPVGPWWGQKDADWEEAIESNVLLPIRLLRWLWPLHEPGASVCFMAGANPNRPMENYSAYSVGKMALLKACEHLDLETPDCKFFALAPGVVLTKIHQATVEAGVHNARLEQARAEGGTPIAKIYECLKWCVVQPKEVIGGRNICVSDDWTPGSGLARMLQGHPNAFKLRRVEL